MNINQAYELINFISNKSQRGTFPPAKFNMLAPICQLEVISKLLGNEQLLNEKGVPPYGYKSNRKIDTILRPLVVGPVLIEPTTYTITAVTKANPGVVTFSDIGDLTEGSPIYISGVIGMTQLNGNQYVVKNFSGNTAELWSTLDAKISTLVFGTYTSGGTAYDGSFEYPEGFIWPDAVHRLDYSPISVLDEDEYPARKVSALKPPSSDYPVCIFRGAKTAADSPGTVRGFIDPLYINFRMSYLKMPVDPYWAYVVTNDEPVYTGSGSVDFSIHPIGHQRICQLILQAVGINLDEAAITQYAAMKEAAGT